MPFLSSTALSKSRGDTSLTMKGGIWAPSPTLSCVLFVSCAILIFNGEINGTQLFSNQNLKELHMRLTSQAT